MSRVEACILSLSTPGWAMMRQVGVSESFGGVEQGGEAAAGFGDGGEDAGVSFTTVVEAGGEAGAAGLVDGGEETAG
eukprot:CAMPEP_0170184084 /NCGR_PEP_ID=MMETSP0040_2-20121228/32665_1 /TAXON_ID=641309 /ORGANISM="Lotharella oceanica, Strain CCMP622" /LENGTH=76 /DNA_ID=CAMNT_0010430031 /DNA_START=221 /DNA_END=447 /DNA_ORIENTATION=+